MDNSCKMAPDGIIKDSMIVWQTQGPLLSLDKEKKKIFEQMIIWSIFDLIWI